jgi:serine/threonine protein kinase
MGTRPPHVTDVEVGKLLAEHKTFDRFRVVKLLGSGSYGTTFLVEDEKNELSVFKFLDGFNFVEGRRVLRSLDEEWRSQVHFESSYVTSVLSSDFTSFKWPLIQLEYCAGGEVCSFLTDSTCGSMFTYSLIAHLFRKMAIPVQVLHAAGMVHGDIKPENFLFSADPRTTPYRDCAIKICDFGVATLLEGAAKSTRWLASTDDYLAPEVRSTRQMTKASDVWALGICLFLFIRGFLPKLLPRDREGLPWGAAQTTELLTTIELDDPARELLEGMLRPDPNERMTIDAVLAYEWLANASSEPLPDVQEQLRKFHLKKKFQFARTRSGSVGRLMRLADIVLGPDTEDDKPDAAAKHSDDDVTDENG